MKKNTQNAFISDTRRNVVHFDHIFVIIMQLMLKPIDFTTNSVLVPHVHVVATSCIRIKYG